MKDTQQRKRKIHKRKPKQYKADLNQKVLTTTPTPAPSKCPPQNPQGAGADSIGGPTCGAAVPLAFTIPAAWRALCRRTGCNVTLRCFYKWARKGRINSIRMGNKIFIRPEMLDQLVNNAFLGEGW